MALFALHFRIKLLFEYYSHLRLTSDNVSFILSMLVCMFVCVCVSVSVSVSLCLCISLSICLSLSLSPPPPPPPSSLHTSHHKSHSPVRPPVPIAHPCWSAPVLTGPLCSSRSRDSNVDHWSSVTLRDLSKPGRVGRTVTEVPVTSTLAKRLRESLSSSLMPFSTTGVHTLLLLF